MIRLELVRALVYLSLPAPLLQGCSRQEASQTNSSAPALTQIRIPYRQDIGEFAMYGIYRDNGPDAPEDARCTLIVGVWPDVIVMEPLDRPGESTCLTSPATATRSAELSVMSERLSPLVDKGYLVFDHARDVAFCRSGDAYIVAASAHDTFDKDSGVVMTWVGIMSTSDAMNCQPQTQEEKEHEKRFVVFSNDWTRMRSTLDVYLKQDGLSCGRSIAYQLAPRQP